MKSANLKLKLTIKGLGFSQQEVAEQMGISDGYFNRLLGKPLNAHYKALTTEAIHTLVNNRREQQKAFLAWLNDPQIGLDDASDTYAFFEKLHDARITKPLNSKGGEN